MTYIDSFDVKLKKVYCKDCTHFDDFWFHSCNVCVSEIDKKASKAAGKEIIGHKFLKFEIGKQNKNNDCKHYREIKIKLNWWKRLWTKK